MQSHECVAKHLQTSLCCTICGLLPLICCLVIAESSTEERVDEKHKILSQEAAEPTAISDVALPSEPTPDFPLVAQAPSSFSLTHSDNLTSNQSQTAGRSELNLPPSQDFPSSLDQSIAESGIRDSVLPEQGTHLSGSTGLNSQSPARNLGPAVLPPVGSSLSVSSHGALSNPLTSLSSFLPNPTSLSSLMSIGGGSSSVLPSGLRLQDATSSSLSEQSHPPQLPPLPPHLSSFSLMNPFAVSSQLQSSSLGMVSQHTRPQTQTHIAQSLPTITSSSSTLPSSQHLQQQHNIQPNVAPAAQGQGSLLQTLTSSSNVPGGMPMPLSHNIMAGAGSLPGSLPNPSALPLLPGMHNSMYPYPYTGALPSATTAVQSLPSQPITSAMVRMNTPAFPSQTLVPGYPSYVAPSLYGNTPPVTNGSFSR